MAGRIKLSAKRAIFSICSAIIANTLIFSTSIAAVAEAAKWDFSVPAVYTLDSCKSDTELDCVEAVGIITDDFEYHPGAYVGYSVTRSTDDLGNLKVGGNETWTVPVGGLNQTLKVDPALATPTHGCCKLQDGSIKRFGAIITTVTDLPDNQRVRLVLRTSWMKPEDVMLKASGSSFSQETIPGGNRWTFTGGNVTGYGYVDNDAGTVMSKLNSETIPADIEIHTLNFALNHAGPTDELSAFPINCSEVGYTGESSNSFTGSVPSWDANTKSLRFNIFAPHLTTTGALHVGFFQFWANTKYMDCKWPGNTLSTSSTFEISVVDETGSEEKITTSTAGIQNGIFHLSVEGLHYSSPTISVKALDQPSGTKPTAGVGKTLKCKKVVKRKTHIVKVAWGKKCPTGYKAVKP